VQRLLALQKLATDLTTIAQPQQSEATTSVNLTDFIEDVRLDLAPLIEAASATLAIAADGCEAVCVSPKTLCSVVYNLLSNAIKYRAPNRLDAELA
jgi:signal transduction histidine kinase